MLHLFESFSIVSDPRVQGRVKYPLSYILVGVFYALIAGKDDWYQVEDFVKEHLDDVNSIHKQFTNKDEEYDGPAHDTFDRVIGILDPKEFNKAFQNWIISFIHSLTGKQIAIDGKTFRGVKKRRADAICHAVNAYCTNDSIVIGQTYVDSKKGELNGIYELLQLLDIEGSCITIDALGTQLKVAQQIIDKAADYILQVKSNQKSTKFSIQALLEKELNNLSSNVFTSSSTELVGGKIVEYNFTALSIEKLQKYDIPEHIAKWPGIKTVLKIDKTVTIKKTNKTTKEKPRYYISSLEDIEQIILYARNHWSIENQLHRTLDVNFLQDKSAKFANNVAMNYDMLQKIIMHLMDDIKKVAKYRSMNFTQKKLENRSPSFINELLSMSDSQ